MTKRTIQSQRQQRISFLLHHLALTLLVYHFTDEQSDGSKRQKSNKFDQEACQNELVKMFVANDIPISFQNFLKVLQQKFSVSSLSQTTLAHDILTPQH